MEVFNEIAKDYDDWYKTKLGSFVDKVETKAAFDLLNVKKKDKILDAGCGTGNFTKKIKENYKKVDIIGIDISNKMLKIARQKNSELEFKKMDLNDLNFEDNTFDKIISMATFEF
ncbi:MAG: class I SAM-dependent methyltransferase, partial [Bacillota bacterium]